MSRSQIKGVLRAVGLYPTVRRWYRRLNPEIRRHEAAEAAFVGQFLRPGSLCFDIGSNVGQTIELVLKAGARVVGVEPNPLCVQVLRRLYGHRPEVRLVEAAVGAAPGVARLHFAGTDSTSSLRGDWCPSHAEEVEVPVRTLDALIAEFGVPDFCKIDVEGYELEVLRGLSTRLPLIAFEVRSVEADRAIACLERLRAIDSIDQGRLAWGDLTGWEGPAWLGFDELVASLKGPLPDFVNLVVRAGDRRG